MVRVYVPANRLQKLWYADATLASSASQDILDLEREILGDIADVIDAQFVSDVRFEGLGRTSICVTAWKGAGDLQVSVQPRMQGCPATKLLI